MAHKELVVALGLIVAASPVFANQPVAPAMVAPAGPPDTLYCLKIGPVTGTRIERVECLTRAEWAEAEVDVDEDWAEEGVAIIANGVWRPVEG